LEPFTKCPNAAWLNVKKSVQKPIGYKFVMTLVSYQTQPHSKSRASVVTVGLFRMSIACWTAVKISVLVLVAVPVLEAWNVFVEDESSDFV